MAATASSAPWKPAVIAPASSAPVNSEMSAPAAKIRSPPVTTTAPGGSALNASAASFSSASRAADRALTLPLASVTTATPSPRRSRLSSDAMARILAVFPLSGSADTPGRHESAAATDVPPTRRRLDATGPSTRRDLAHRATAPSGRHGVVALPWRARDRWVADHVPAAGDGGRARHAGSAPSHTARPRGCTVSTASTATRRSTCSVRRAPTPTTASAWPSIAHAARSTGTSRTSTGSRRWASPPRSPSSLQLPASGPRRERSTARCDAASVPMSCVALPRRGGRPVGPDRRRC